MLYIANTTAVQASMLLSFECTAKRLRDEVALEEVFGRGGGRRLASSDCKGVDKFEDEVAGEGAA
jgi:hypothetical protein